MISFKILISSSVLVCAYLSCVEESQKGKIDQSRCFVIDGSLDLWDLIVEKARRWISKEQIKLSQELQNVDLNDLSEVILRDEIISKK